MGKIHPFDREIREIYRSGHLDTSDWNAVCAITLTLKQVIWSNGFLIPLDQWQCSRALNHFMNLLNRKVYRNAFYRHGKRLRVTPILERGICGAFHWHLSLERPGRISEFRFRFLVDQAWSETHWGDDRMSLVRSQLCPPFFLPFSPNRMRLVPTCGTPSTQSTASPERGHWAGGRHRQINGEPWEANGEVDPPGENEDQRSFSFTGAQAALMRP